MNGGLKDQNKTNIKADKIKPEELNSIGENVNRKIKPTIGHFFPLDL